MGLDFCWIRLVESLNAPCFTDNDRLHPALWEKGQGARIWTNAGGMLAHRLQLCLNVNTALRKWPRHQIRCAESMLLQCWASVADAGPTLKQHLLRVWCSWSRLIAPCVETRSRVIVRADHCPIGFSSAFLLPSLPDTPLHPPRLLLLPTTRTAWSVHPVAHWVRLWIKTEKYSVTGFESRSDISLSGCAYTVQDWGPWCSG